MAHDTHVPEELHAEHGAMGEIVAEAEARNALAMSMGARYDEDGVLTTN